MQSAETKAQQAKKKKRIAPQKEAPLPVVASIPEDIIAASFRDDHPNATPSTAGLAKEGIEIDIRKTPMVNIQSTLRERGLAWQGQGARETEGGAMGTLTQVDVVKRVLDRQTRLYQVRDALSASESEISDSAENNDSDLPSVLDASDDEEGSTNGEESSKDPTLAAANPVQVEMEVAKGEEAMEEALDEGQEEEWGLKNIGDYDLEDNFIDDSEIHHYFDNIRKKPKYSGFYIHKGPLRMIEQVAEPKPARAQTKKAKEARARNDESKPGNTQQKQRTPNNKSKGRLQSRRLPHSGKKDTGREEKPPVATSAEK